MTPPYAIPETSPCNLSYEEIERYANHIASAHNLSQEGPADITRLVEDLGGKIEYADGAESLHVNGKGDFVVKVPYFTSSLRDRFTIAHELGHYFLHYRLPSLKDSQSYGRGGKNRAETEANVFASCLLMPRDQFASIWKNEDGDEWAVSAHFNVSPSAARGRAKILDLL